MNQATLSADTLAPSAPVLSVSLLNRLARERLEAGFPLCWVVGEVSNLTIAASGHAYFSLKDAGAQVRCVMFRNRLQLLGWRLENGQHIEARVLVSLYEARGDFQLNVETARKAGLGNLYEQFLQLKARLEREGLFAQEAKRALPPFPRHLGIVTSSQAAALRDVLSTLQRRAPHIDLTIYPTAVQGAGAAAQIVAAIAHANTHAACDALIVCRGGGSLEDLWAFNDEGVARAIRASRIPVITGIGHETDFTIADFAADRRAATPTAAAELAAPERAAGLRQLEALRQALARHTARELQRRSQQLDTLSRRLIHPGERLARQGEQLDALRRRIGAACLQRLTALQTRTALLTRRLHVARPDTHQPRNELRRHADRLRTLWQIAQQDRQARIIRLAAGLAHLDPHAVMARGYSVVRNARGAIVSDSRGLEPNDQVTVSFHTGRVEARVTALTHETSPTKPT